MLGWLEPRTGQDLSSIAAYYINTGNKNFFQVNIELGEHCQHLARSHGAVFSRILKRFLGLNGLLPSATGLLKDQLITLPHQLYGSSSGSSQNSKQTNLDQKAWPRDSA